MQAGVQMRLRAGADANVTASMVNYDAIRNDYTDRVDVRPADPYRDNEKCLAFELEMRAR